MSTDQCDHPATDEAERTLGAEALRKLIEVLKDVDDD